MEDFEDLGISTHQPTAQRPLRGATVLVVEDSRYASEALRLLCLRSGARIRRADCLAAANNHLRTYRPTVAIVDLGLPDGSGLDLIATLHAAVQRPTVLIATSGQGCLDLEAEALRLGANEYLAKPIESLAAFQQSILKHLPPEAQPKGLRSLTSETVTPDLFALDEDLSQAMRLLEDKTTPSGYIGAFLRSLAQTGRDEDLIKEAEAMLKPNVSDETRARIRRLLGARLKQRRAV